MDLYCIEWVINLRPYKQQKIILSGTCRALEVKLIKWLSSWPLPLRLIIFKLETINTNLKKVEGPDGSLQMDTLHVCLFLLSQFSHLSLTSLPHSQNELGTAWKKPGAHTSSCLVCWYDSDSWKLPLSYWGGSRKPNLSLERNFFFFVLQITDWSLKPNKMKCCVFAKLTRLPWDCVGSAVKGKGSGQPASSRAQGFSLSSGDSTIEWRAQGFEGSWGCF